MDIDKNRSVLRISGDMNKNNDGDIVGKREERKSQCRRRD